ncbi:MAG TPA: 1-acyl-sn-glycerol-3-phosphate acyltransferase [Actinomycetota bacterium]
MVDLIRELSIDPAGPEQPPVTPATSLADVGFDSLAFAELAFALEREFDLDLDAAVLDEHGVYPEGTRAPGRLLPFLHGAAWLALRTGVPLVPVGIAGRRRPCERWCLVGPTYGSPSASPCW